MKKSLFLVPIMLVFLSTSVSAGEENHANNFGFGIDVNNSGNNYGVGISVLLPWFSHGHVSAKFHGGIGILSAGIYEPMPYTGLTVMVGAIAFGGYGRFYGFLDPAFFFDSAASPVNTLWVIGGGFGFEFFLDEAKHGTYYLETGGGGGGGSEGAEKNLNGFFLRVGYNYRL